MSIEVVICIIHVNNLWKFEIKLIDDTLQQMLFANMCTSCLDLNIWVINFYMSLSASCSYSCVEVWHVPEVEASLPQPSHRERKWFCCPPPHGLLLRGWLCLMTQATCTIGKWSRCMARSEWPWVGQVGSGTIQQATLGLDSKIGITSNWIGPITKQNNKPQMKVQIPLVNIVHIATSTNSYCISRIKYEPIEIENLLLHVLDLGKSPAVTRSMP